MTPLAARQVTVFDTPIPISVGDEDLTLPQIKARDGIAYANPVIIDMYKINADPQMVANGWNYLGQVNG